MTIFLYGMTIFNLGCPLFLPVTSTWDDNFFTWDDKFFGPATTIFNLGRPFLTWDAHYFICDDQFFLTWELLLHDLDGTDGHVQLVHEVLGEIAEFQVPGPRNTLVATLGANSVKKARVREVFT